MRAHDVAIPRRLVRAIWVISAAWMAYAALQPLTAGAVIRPLLVTLHLEIVTLFCVSTLVIAVDGGFRFVRWKALTYTDLISYGLYLMHQPLNWALHTGFHWNNWKDLRLSMMSFVLVYVIAALAWQLFEKRLVRYGRRFRYQDNDEGAAFVAAQGP